MARRRRDGARQKRSAEAAAGRPGRETAATGAWHSHVAVPLAVLALVCLAAYWNSFRAELLLDNQTIILKDTRLRTMDWEAIHNIFTRHYWWPFLQSRLFRPVTTFSYWINYALLGNGPRPFGYHVVNLLLHLGNVALVWSLVAGITRRRWVGVFAAAIFACHPLTVEAVTNVVGRADLLAAMSVLGGLWLYRRCPASGAPLRGAWLGALGATYLAGVFCKESAVILPAVLLVHDGAFAPAARSRLAALRQWLGRMWPAYLAMAPGLAALLLARWRLFHDSPLGTEFGSDNVIAVAPFWTGVMTAIKVIGYYFALVVWPARLSCDYSYNAVTLFGWTFGSGQDPHAWLALAALVALFAAGVVAWRFRPDIFFVLGFGAVALLPVSNLAIPVGTVMADRLMYLPLAGLTTAGVLALAAGLHRAARYFPPGTRPALRVTTALTAAAVVTAFTVRTIQRNEDWSSSAQLWSASALAAPDSIKVIRGQASVASESAPGEAGPEQALAILARGVAIAEQAPLPLRDMPAALYEDVGRYNIALSERLVGAGRLAEARTAASDAVTALKRAEAIDQEINRQGRQRLEERTGTRATVPDTITGTIYRNLGAAYLAAGDPFEAIATLTYLQRTQPDSDEAYYGLGVAQGGAAGLEQAKGNTSQVAAYLQDAAVNLIAAVVLNPGHPQAWQTLEQVYSLLSPGSDAVRWVGGRPSLNMEHPLVPGHLRQACARLVRLLADAGRTQDADRWRARMESEFGVAPVVFDGPGRGGGK